MCDLGLKNLTEIRRVTSGLYKAVQAAAGHRELAELNPLGENRQMTESLIRNLMAIARNNLQCLCVLFTDELNPGSGVAEGRRS